MDFIKENIMELLALGLSIFSLIVATTIAVKGWWRHRNIYDIERTLFFRNPKTDKTNNNNKLREKLNSGEYTILHTGEYGGYIELIIGKLKK
jgi:hypothetical protein